MYLFKYILKAMALFLLCSTTVLSNTLIDKLKDGGFVVYFRHEVTDKTKVDKRNIDIEEYKRRKGLEKCKTQRNISEAGIKSAKHIFKVLKEKDIKISKVLSSPFCRCVDSAILITGQTPQISDYLYFSMKSNKKIRKESSDKLRALLSAAPDEGSNIFIFSHTSNLKEAVNIWPKPEGVAHVFKPTKNGQEYIGKILPSDWK